MGLEEVQKRVYSGKVTGEINYSAEGSCGLRGA